MEKHQKGSSRTPNSEVGNSEFRSRAAVELRIQNSPLRLKVVIVLNRQQHNSELITCSSGTQNSEFTSSRTQNSEFTSSRTQNSEFADLMEARILPFFDQEARILYFRGEEFWERIQCIFTRKREFCAFDPPLSSPPLSEPGHILFFFFYFNSWE